jgi:hypothetical protein
MSPADPAVQSSGRDDRQALNRWQRRPAQRHLLRWAGSNAMEAVTLSNVFVRTFLFFRMGHLEYRCRRAVGLGAASGCAEPPAVRTGRSIEGERCFGRIAWGRTPPGSGQARLRATKPRPHGNDLWSGGTTLAGADFGTSGVSPRRQLSIVTNPLPTCFVEVGRLHDSRSGSLPSRDLLSPEVRVELF